MGQRRMQEMEYTQLQNLARHEPPRPEERTQADLIAVPDRSFEKGAEDAMKLHAPLSESRDWRSDYRANLNPQVHAFFNTDRFDSTPQVARGSLARASFYHREVVH